MTNRAERRVSGVSTTVEAWEHSKTLHDVELPSGNVCDFEMPDLQSYIVRGVVPNPLIPMARRWAYENVELSKLEDKEEAETFDLFCWAVAQGVKKPDLVKKFGGIDGAIEWVATRMPPDDRMKLLQLAFHLVDEEALLRSLGDLLKFPGQGPSAEPAGGVGTDGAAAVGAG